MLNQTSNLSKEQQQLLHADFLANERDYLSMRDSLLSQYRGQWVAVQGHKVISSGYSLLEVTDAASTFGGHPYVALVGGEDAVVFRVRGGAYPNDLEHLLTGVTDENRPGEWDTGPAVGKEVW